VAFATRTLVAFATRYNDKRKVVGMAGVAPALRTQLEGFQTFAVVLLQAGRTDQALQWADQVAARDPALGWSYNHRRG